MKQEINSQEYCITCQKHDLGCIQREFRDDSDILRCRLGRIEENYRLPIVPVTPATKEKLRGVLSQLELI